jgi:enoyl-CoA hydratase/carnithine racemase
MPDAPPEGQGVRVSRREGVVVLHLDRPHRANAYNSALLTALEAAVEHAYLDPAVHVIVLTGAGRHFCAGADLTELGQREPLQALDLHSRRLFTRIARGPKPTFAAVHGAALGGGLELALACDFRIVTPDARLGLPEISMGLIPAAGGCHRLPHLVGAARAREMVLLGRELSGLEAHAWGLALQTAPAEQLLEQTLQHAQTLAQRTPAAVLMARLALDAAFEYDDHGLHLEGPGQALLYARRAAELASP